MPYNPLQTLNAFRQSQENKRQRGLAELKQEREDITWQQQQEDRQRSLMDEDLKRKLEADKVLDQKAIELLTTINPDSDTFEEDVYGAMDKFTDSMKEYGYSEDQIRNVAESLFESGSFSSPEAIRMLQEKAGIRRKPEPSMTPYQKAQIAISQKLADHKVSEKPKADRKAEAEDDKHRMGLLKQTTSLIKREQEGGAEISDAELSDLNAERQKAGMRRIKRVVEVTPGGTSFWGKKLPDMTTSKYVIEGSPEDTGGEEGMVGGEEGGGNTEVDNIFDMLKR